MDHSKRACAELEPLEDRRLLSATLVADIMPLPPYDQTWANPGPVYDVGGLMLFVASDGVHGRELWRTDGSAKGTRMVKDLVPGPNYLGADSFTAFNDAVYFFSDNALWRTDGSERGTFVVQHDQRARYFSGPSQLTAFNGALYFTDRDASGAARLWRTDGTPDGLSRVLPFSKPTAADSKALTQFVALGDVLTFVYGDALWRTDGTRAGTYPAAPGVVLAGPTHRVGDALLFAGRVGTTTGLWRTDGSAGGTGLVQAMDLGFGGVGNGIVHDGQLYFAGRDATHGTELWRSDGTAAGTVMVADIRPAPPKSTAAGIRPAGLRDAFAWPSPGLGSSYGALVSFVDNTGLTDPLASSTPANFHVAAGRVVFTAYTPTEGFQLFATDGTAPGTIQLASLGSYSSSYSGGSSIAYREFRNVGDALFFTTQTSATDGGTLHVTDGTRQGTRRLWTADSSSSSGGIYGLAAAQGSLYFTAYTWQHGRELMRWDQTGGITGFAYDDANGNGVRDLSELPLAGWRVFLDRNGDGLFNRGENFVFAEEDGAYGFPAFPDGSYTLRVSRPDDDWTSTPVGAPVRRGRTTWRDVSAARATPVHETISGTVLDDQDFDGTRDGGETGRAGVRVYLDANRDGHYTRGERFAFSDAAGNYLIDNVLPGRYRVAMTELGEGHEYTRGIDKTVVVLPGSSPDIDFGIGYDGGTGMVHGVVFDDRDGDGKQDDGETGVAGARVFLEERDWFAAGIGSRTVLTDAGGYYKFTRLRRGQYRVSQAQFSGHWASTTGTVTSIDLRARERRIANFGNSFAGTASVYGSIFNDLNENRTRDAGEEGLEDVEVYLDLNRNGARDPGEASTRTSSSGEYKFEKQLSGAGTIGLVMPGEWWRLTDPFARRYWDFSMTPQSRRDITPIALAHRTGVTGIIFLDRDRDGRRDANEDGADGISVWLDHDFDGDYGSDDSIRTTADGGHFTFYLAPGTYHLWLGDDRVTKPSPVVVTAVRGVMDEMEVALQPL